MPISVNALLSSSGANATFMDRTVDTDTSGKMNLINTDAESGSTVTNVQKEINLSKKQVNAAQVVSNSDQLTLDDFSLLQIFRLSGNAAPVNLNSLAFSNQPLDGCEIIIIGQDDTNTVTIAFNDSQYGQYMNGSATLLRGYSIRFLYDSGLERFIEVGRNF